MFVHRIGPKRLLVFRTNTKLTGVAHDVIPAANIMSYNVGNPLAADQYSRLGDMAKFKWVYREICYVVQGSI